MNWQKSIKIPGKHRISTHAYGAAIVIAIATLLSACGGDSVGKGTPREGNETPAGLLDADQKAFQTELWQPLLLPNCGGCHKSGGAGTGSFADRLDFPQSYIDANARVNKTNVSSSLIVARVASGHNCWTDCTDAAAQLEAGINAWVNPDPDELDLNNSDTQDPVDLTAQLNPPPPDIDPTAEALVLDVEDATQQAGFEANVYNPILRVYCSNCHSDDALAAQKQQPYFADTDPDVAYTAIVENRKVDINTPTNSRIYLRLAQDSHNCWTNCTSNAAQMAAAITAWRDGLPTPTTYVDGDNAGTGETAPFSKGLSLVPGQAIVVSGGTRYERNLVAKWEFKDADENPDATVISDTSNVLPLINLNVVGNNVDTDVNNDWSWRSGWGIQFGRDAYARAQSVEDSQKIYDLIVPRNEYSVEMWVIPDNVTQEGPAVMASYSGSNNSRNFAIGQTLYSYDFLNRNTASGLGSTPTFEGQPTLLTNPDDEDLQATQQHVVLTYDPVNGRVVYINGVPTNSNGDDEDGVLGGSLNEWDDTFMFSLGAEQDGTNPWAGTIRFAALYNRALSQEQVQQNFDAGVGQKFNMLFKVGHLTAAIPDESYVWFEVSEFDNYSYLFSFPRFVVLTDTPSPANFSMQIQGMRIGVNGKEAPVGQAFLHMDKTITFPDDTAATGYYDLIGRVANVAVDGVLTSVPESATGTIISKQNGVELDQFYLTFKKLADVDESAAKSAETSFPPQTGDVPYPAPDSGLEAIDGVRMFEELNAMMAEVTGVPPDTQIDPPTITDTVHDVFREIEQALPSNPSLDGFLASHQMSVSRLAMSYCAALVRVPSLRDAFFNVGGNFEFDQAPAVAFSTTAKQDIIVDSLYDKVLLNNVDKQLSKAEVRAVLFGSGSLHEQLVASCGGSCNAQRTREIVTSMCITVLGSAGATVQ